MLLFLFAFIEVNAETVVADCAKMFAKNIERQSRRTGGTQFSLNQRRSSYRTTSRCA